MLTGDSPSSPFRQADSISILCTKIVVNENAVARTKHSSTGNACLSSARFVIIQRPPEKLLQLLARYCIDVDTEAALCSFRNSALCGRFVTTNVAIGDEAHVHSAAEVYTVALRSSSTFSDSWRIYWMSSNSTYCRLSKPIFRLRPQLCSRWPACQKLWAGCYQSNCASLGRQGLLKRQSPSY